MKSRLNVKVLQRRVTESTAGGLVLSDPSCLEYKHYNDVEGVSVDAIGTLCIHLTREVSENRNFSNKKCIAEGMWISYETERPTDDNR